MEPGYRILIATDYSEAAMNAEMYAVQFAASTKSNVIFIHVCGLPKINPRKAADIKNIERTIAEEEKKKLVQHAQKIYSALKIKESDLPYECIIREGNAAKEIIKEAKESAMSFIVAGTHGATGFRGNIFGSHTWSIIRESDVPVMVIPGDASFRKIKNIVFATEYRTEEIPVMSFLTFIAKQLDAAVTVLHVTAYGLSKNFERNVFETFRKEIKKSVSYPKLSIRLIKSDSLPKGLNNFCSDKHVDWLVMSPHKRNIFEKIFLTGTSTTRRMSFHTSLPLLTIPDFFKPRKYLKKLSGLQYSMMADYK